MEWDDTFYVEIKEALSDVKEVKAGMENLNAKMDEVSKIVTLLRGNGTTGYFKRVELIERALRKRWERLIVVFLSLLGLATAIKAFFF